MQYISSGEPRKISACIMFIVHRKWRFYATIPINLLSKNVMSIRKVLTIDS